MEKSIVQTACYCGSGKHYWECHGALQEENVALDAMINRFMRDNPKLVHVEPAGVNGSLLGRGIVFVHVPKTAGTTLNWILYALAVQFHAICFRAFGAVYGQVLGEGKGEAADFLRQTDRDIIRSAGIFIGHVPVSAWDDVMGSRLIAYVTILRDPAERMISHYLHGVDRNGWSADTSVHALVSEGRLVDNLQVRMLAGCADRRQPCDEAMLDAAYAKLRDRFALVGTCERFDAFLAALLGLYNCPDIIYGRRNVTATPIGKTRRESLRGEVADFNRFDTRLYARVREMGDVWVNRVDAASEHPRNPDLLTILDGNGEFLRISRNDLPRLDDMAGRAGCQLVHA